MKKVVILLLLSLSLSLFGSTLNGLIVYASKHSTVVKQNQAQVDLAQTKRDASRIQQYGELNLVGSIRIATPLTPMRVEVEMQDANSLLISPCPSANISQASEVKLAQLPVYDKVEIIK